MIWHSASKPRKKDGKAPILIRITIDGVITEIDTGIMILPNNQDNKNKKCLPEDSDYGKINEYLEEKKQDLFAYFRLLS